MKIYLTLPSATDLTEEFVNSSVRRLDLELRAKNSNELWLVIFDADEEEIDITGMTVFFTVKSKPSDADASAAIKKDVTSHYNAGSGETKIELTPTDTASVVGTYFYSIKIKDGTDIYTLAEGIVDFKQELSTRTS